MRERLVTGLIAFGAIAGLVVLAVAGCNIGQQIGEPETVTIQRPEPPDVPQPPVTAGLLGFEGISDRLQIGFWGEVATVEEGEGGAVIVTLDDGEFVDTEITIAGEDLVYALQPGEGAIEPGDLLTVLEQPDGETTVLVTRRAESIEQ